jgi:hypothetical protein
MFVPRSAPMKSARTMRNITFLLLGLYALLLFAH